MKPTLAILESLKRLEAEGRVVETAQPRPAITETMSEREFQAAVIALAIGRGWKDFHCFDSRKSVAGWPDLALVRERFILAELKAEDGSLSAPQANWIDWLRAAGVEVYIWRPSMWAELERVLA